VVDGSGDSSGPSLGLGEVDGGSSLRPQCVLASVTLRQLGSKGCLLVSKFIMVLGGPPLSVDLSDTGSHLLLLLLGLLLIEGELHSWLRYHSPHRDHRDGLEGRSVLRGWRSDDGVSWGHHVARLGPRGSRAPLVPEVAPPSSEDS
jgi:hypothetical protein